VCYIITIAVSNTSKDAIRAAHAAPDLSIDVTANPAAVAAAGAGRTPLLVTGGGCSCGWYTEPASHRHEQRAARARARYQRLGWSQAKIDRALASVVCQARPGDGLHPVIVDLLRSIAASCGRVSVWVHDFHGRLEHEPYTIARREQWTLAELEHRASTLGLDTIADIRA
jgi:hypothetical protein